MAAGSRVKSTLGGVSFSLADWVPPQERYQRRYQPAQLDQDRVSTAGQGVLAFNPYPVTATVVIDSWAAGEGERVWRPQVGAYNQSRGVALADDGDALVLSRSEESITVPNTPDNLDVFGLGNDGLYLGGDDATDQKVWVWDQSTTSWSLFRNIGAVANFVSIVDGDTAATGTLFSSHTNNKIMKFTIGAHSVHYNTGTGDDFTNDPVLLAWGGQLFALDGADLYEVDVSTTDTRTLRVDLQGTDGYGGSTVHRRIAGSDVGPVWFQRLWSGETLIHQYNVKADAHKVIGRLPSDFVQPGSIYWAHGFTFVGYRVGEYGSVGTEGYVFAFNGGQQAVIGPIRDTGGPSVGIPTLVGVIGDDLIIAYDDDIWAYNFSRGGLSHVGRAGSPTGAVPQTAAVFGDEILTIATTDNTTERFVPDEYDAVTDGTISTGRFDFNFPTLRKRLLDVTVVTDPLPANTAVTAEVSVDGGAYQSLTGTHNGDGNVRFTWAASTTTVDLIGYQFEIRLTFDSTAAANTPTVRQITATAGAASHRIEWVMAVDVTDWSHKQIDDLNGLANTVATFVDKFQDRDGDGAGDTTDVEVTSVITPSVFRRELEEYVYAVVQVRSRDVVGASGGSS